MELDLPLVFHEAFANPDKHILPTPDPKAETVYFDIDRGLSDCNDLIEYLKSNYPAVKDLVLLNNYIMTEEPLMELYNQLNLRSLFIIVCQGIFPVLGPGVPTENGIIIVVNNTTNRVEVRKGEKFNPDTKWYSDIIGFASDLGLTYEPSYCRFDIYPEIPLPGRENDPSLIHNV